MCAHLINIDDAALGHLEVVGAALQQLVQDGLHVIAHVTGLRQRGGVRHCKGHFHQPRQRLGQQCLPRACATQQPLANKADLPLTDNKSADEDDKDDNKDSR